MSSLKQWLAAALCCLPLAAAAAVGGILFSPQGEAPNARQVRASFPEAAVRFGDPRLPMPFDIDCAEPGSGRWADDRNWVYDFKRELPAGVTCSFRLKADFRLLSGAALTGKTMFRFDTGGPAVAHIHPAAGVAWHQIDEEQIFLLRLTGPVAENSIAGHAWCEAQGVNERVPARLVKGKPREDLVRQLEPNTPAAHLLALQCAQRLPNDAALRLVWDRGIATPNGMATRQPQRFDYKVRKAFTVNFSCERESAHAGCVPLRPIRLEFSAPISRELAERIRLNSVMGARKPDDTDGAGDTVTGLEFKPPFPENATLTIDLPRELKDDAGRAPANAAQFPLHPRTAAMPPLAKFAAAPFGILELNDEPALPVTLRNVEPDLLVRTGDGRVAPMASTLAVDGDAAVIEWLSRLQRYHESAIDIDGKTVETRSLSLLAKQPGAQRMNLPSPHPDENGQRPFEVIGIPFRSPGFYVVELESQRLGAALLGKIAPMYVRTSVLVTNLAVHLKIGRENGAVWVTTLDGGKPVANADVRIADCFGKPLWRGATGADGVAHVPVALDPNCGDRNYDQRLVQGLFVSARAIDAKGRPDMAFALSSWNDGIESFRFNVPTDMSQPSTLRAHTVFDRTLLRAGQTVSMKHILRTETGAGFALPRREQLPTRVRIVHQGSGQEYRFPLTWRDRAAAETMFRIPQEARLGRYEVILDQGKVDAAGEAQTAPSFDGDDGARSRMSGSFRVEEFRLPVLQGRIAPPKTDQVAPKSLPLTLQLNYLNGGGASGLPVQVSALLRPRALRFAGYEEFSFATRERGEGGQREDDQKIVADKLAAKLDRNGIASITLPDLPPVSAAAELLTEMTFADPNGEIGTVSQTVPLWPAAVIAGIKTESWMRSGKRSAITALTLDLDGRPLAGVPLEVRARARRIDTHRKRMVGGFYAYENTRSERDLGLLCQGNSDAHGMLRCDVDIGVDGEVEFEASARDEAKRSATAFATAWLGNAEWFGGDNGDRIDILPEKRRYKPGETASFQVRMPFRQATALVAIEREGVIETRVVQLSGSNPVIKLPVRAEWGANVYVSVLAVRPRLREVPWYSFFTWGWREPRNWWTDYRAYTAPGTTVDLGKPAFRYGIAEIGVGAEAFRLDVKVDPAQAVYPVRGRAEVAIRVSLPDGKPAAGAEIALAAVDEALLELQANDSWDLIGAMVQRRSYGVETATAQMQVIGKRHFGRKALPAGGGGKAVTRELVDTLLLWQPAIRLDGQGRAHVTVPLNDALTSFRIVAVATAGEGRFGTGSASIRSSQDVQLIAGLPPLVREGDRYGAMVTLRNGAARAMAVDVEARMAGRALDAQPRRVRLEAGESQQLSWDVVAPQDVKEVAWELRAQEVGSGGNVGARDALKLSQKVLPAVPVTVQQATLIQLDGAAEWKLGPPAGSLPGRGGVALSLSPSITGAADGLRRYFETYPYSCLEQKTSRAIGLQDETMWQRIVAELPIYLDDNGLARYFPSSASGIEGSEILTAYVLAITHEAGWSVPDASRERMLAGLQAFVEGRIERRYEWLGRNDRDERRLQALEALSRYGRMPVRALDAIEIAPARLSTAALLDWLSILQRTNGIAGRAQLLETARQELASRLDFSGTTLKFRKEADEDFWWRMVGPDLNAGRTVLLALDDATLVADAPRLVTGALGRQSRGHWSTTTANAWGLLALKKFAARYEADKVGGTTRATLRQGGAATSASHAWGGAGRIDLPWKVVAPRADDGLTLKHDGPGRPWVTMQSLAAVPLKAPFEAGYAIRRRIEAVEQKESGHWSRGDILRVTLEVDAQADMSWVVVSDPVPAGATVLGSSLGRDSAIAAQGNQQKGAAWLAFEERSFDAFRAYYQWAPAGKFSISYTLRLNNPGKFHLPPTRVEAMYAPERQAMMPNAVLEVQ
ncbi:alpha-2-macroglobulin family protein [Noviherbaspirillum pedocola]|nr:MG2 domain-containing protein [Noviherbaspirillum pedocola]